jgi:hypothetical protein
MAALVILGAMRFNLLLAKGIPKSRFIQSVLPFGDGTASIFLRSALFSFSPGNSHGSKDKFGACTNGHGRRGVSQGFR